MVVGHIAERPKTLIRRIGAGGPSGCYVLQPALRGGIEYSAKPTRLFRLGDRAVPATGGRRGRNFDGVTSRAIISSARADQPRGKPNYRGGKHNDCQNKCCRILC